MPNFNIHWKGYPHRRLPRIRVKSTSGGTRNIHRTAESTRRPLGTQLQREQKKQTFAFRIRRARKSRSSSSAGRARKHASLRARQHIQVFGWNTDVASKANTIKTKSVASSIKDSQPPVVPEDTFSRTTVIDSNDGAAASACRLRNSTQSENIYSLMQVAEVPVYWTNRRKATLASSGALARTSKGAGQYAHVGRLDPVSRRRSSRPPRQLGKSRTYDNRIDPRTLLDRDRPTKSFPTHPAKTTRRTASRRAPSKSWQDNPELRRILSSKISKAKENPQSTTSSMKSVVQSLLSDPASRTQSQRKALNRFTKELELYLQAAKSLPKQSLVPSPSATTVSAHTVEELRPYQSQFRAAGLAVSAADQLRATSNMAKLKKSPSPPPTPPKDGRYASRKTTARKSKVDQEQEAHHHHKTGSIASFDTETTVMDFTPPHEQAGPRETRVRRKSSSDHTIMNFTPPHETPPPQPNYTPPPPPRASIKKSLPWLRKKELPEESPSPSPKHKSIVTASTVKDRTRNPSDVLLFSSAAERTLDQTKDRSPRPSQHRVNEVRWEDKKLNITEAVEQRKLYNDVATQAAPELSDDYVLADQGVQYADATTQTNFKDAGASMSVKRDDIERRAPLIQNKSKTFPTSSKRCDGDCSQAARKVSILQSPRKRYQDQAMQTELVEKDPNTNQTKVHESKKSSFKVYPQTPEPIRTFPFASPSPFQRSPLTPSPHKSVDEPVGKKTPAQNEPSETQVTAPESPSPPCHAPWPPRCTQCSAEIKPSTRQTQSPMDMESVSPVSLAPELRLNHENENRQELPPRSHTCTARSSLECQQCAPVDYVASAPQLIRPPDSPCSPQTASRKSSVRTTPWAATLEAEFEEIIQGCHSPEERFMQRKIIQDTIDEYAKPAPLDDPIKKPSQPRLRIRPPTARDTPKQEQNRSTAPVPSAPVFIDTILPQSPTASTTLTRDSSGISDRAVFRGLHVATAAACDEDVAKWIEEITGTGVRKFLSDLSAFDGLGFNTLARVAKRAAKQRRGEVLAWERVREKRMQERKVDDDWEDCAFENEKGVCKDKKMGFVAGDETVNIKAERERSGEEVAEHMITARERRSREGLRERAIRMGWRDRSVSGGE